MNWKNNTQIPQRLEFDPSLFKSIIRAGFMTVGVIMAAVGIYAFMVIFLSCGP